MMIQHILLCTVALCCPWRDDSAFGHRGAYSVPAKYWTHSPHVWTSDHTILVFGCKNEMDGLGQTWQLDIKTKKWTRKLKPDLARALKELRKTHPAHLPFYCTLSPDRKWLAMEVGRPLGGPLEPLFVLPLLAEGKSLKRFKDVHHGPHAWRTDGLSVFSFYFVGYGPELVKSEHLDETTTRSGTKLSGYDILDMAVSSTGEVIVVSSWDKQLNTPTIQVFNPQSMARLKVISLKNHVNFGPPWQAKISTAAGRILWHVSGVELFRTVSLIWSTNLLGEDLRLESPSLQLPQFMGAPDVYRANPQWSPEGKRFSYVDHDKINVVDVKRN